MKFTNAMKGIIGFFIALAVLTSCSPGYGCIINESAHVKMDKDGKLPKTRGTSSLFPKDMNKKRKKRR